MKFRVFWDVLPYGQVEDVSEVPTTSIIRTMMETMRTSETSVNILTTRQYVPEDSELLLSLPGARRCTEVKSPRAHTAVIIIMQLQVF
jgi:hypothetical protein